MATIEKYNLANGSVRYRVRGRVDGRQVKQGDIRTRKEAELVAATLEVKKADGSYVRVSAGRTPVGDQCRAWLDGRADLTASTRERYAGIIRTHIEPRWGPVALGDVRHSAVQSWSADLAAGGMAAASVRKTVRVLSLAFDLAVADRLVAANPCAKVKIARPVAKRRRYLTRDQVWALADAAGDRQAVVLVLCYCGLRWGELAGLRVRDVDLMRRRITVARSVTEVNGHLDWTDGKTHTRRSVPVPRFLVDDLAVAMAGKGPDDLAFSGERRDSVLRVRNARRSWFDAAVAESGAPERLTPHELRHTAASLAISVGANVKAVQAMLGHGSAALTLDTYADLFPDDLDAVADAFDADCARSVPARAARTAAMIG
jgi:integrase